jgi:hypothetical protein
MAKIKILPRTGKDLFDYLSLAEIDRNRANESALMEFVQIDNTPLTLEHLVSIKGETLAILKGRIFTLQTKGITQTDNEILHDGITEPIARKAISHNILEEIQLKTQRMKEQNEGDIVSVIKSMIPLFYDIEISQLEKMPYELAAFMFTKINFFLAQTSEPQDEFDLDV